MTNNLLINNYIIYNIHINYNIKFLCHLFVNNEFRVLSFVIVIKSLSVSYVIYLYAPRWSRLL